MTTNGNWILMSETLWRMWVTGFVAQVLDFRTDTGIMSHWKDYQKLVVYTYLTYSASAPFYVSVNKTVNIPMIPQIGYFKAGYLPKLDCQGAELLFEVSRGAKASGLRRMREGKVTPIITTFAVEWVNILILISSGCINQCNHYVKRDCKPKSRLQNVNEFVLARIF